MRNHILFGFIVVVAALSASPGGAGAAPITFRGCFASGSQTDGTASGEFNGDVDTITGALVGTGSWKAADATKLKNASRATITACVNAAKAASKPGDEFIFYFAGHGGDSSFPDAAEAGEGGGSDNHIRVGNTGGGAADRITDDELAVMLSGFKKSVTMSVVLHSCFSHTFFDGANDLGSVMQINGTPVAAGTHLALLAASSTAEPRCGGGFTPKLAEGLQYSGGFLKADKNKDGVVTTEEAHMWVDQGSYIVTGQGRCDEAGCSVPPSPDETYEGVTGCGPADEVCPTIAEAQAPVPGTLLLILAGLLALRARARKA